MFVMLTAETFRGVCRQLLIGSGGSWRPGAVVGAGGGVRGGVPAGGGVGGTG